MLKLKLFLLVFFFLVNNFIFSQTRTKVFFVETNVDTTIIPIPHGHGTCRNINFSSFINDSMILNHNLNSLLGIHENFPHSSKYENNEKEDSVTFNASVNFLFVWQENVIFSVVFQQSGVPTQKFDYLPLTKPNLNYIRGKLLRNHRFNDILEITGIENSATKISLFSLDSVKNKTGLYQLISRDTLNNQKEEKIKFLVVDNDKNLSYIRPVQYWLYMPIFSAINFYEKYSLNPVSVQYDYHPIVAIKLLKERDRLKPDFKINDLYQLVALGFGDKEVTQLPKWKKMIDFNVLGNYKCMPENYAIPSSNYFAHTYPNYKLSLSSNRNLIPLDSVFSNIYNEKSRKNELIYNQVEIGHKTQIGGYTKQLFVDLKRKFDCTGIYGINQYDYAYGKFERLGTVNNIEYLPEVYFLPDYFKIKSINGLSLKEFAKKQCKK